MLILPRFARLVPKSTMLALGTVLYGIHLLGVPLLSETPFLWLMPIFGGVGGAIIITAPISYYQDLLRERPGTASAMLAVQKLVADVLTAVVFAATAQVAGFEVVAVTGVMISLLGAVGLYLTKGLQQMSCSSIRQTDVLQRWVRCSQREESNGPIYTMKLKLILTN